MAKADNKEIIILPTEMPNAIMAEFNNNLNTGGLLPYPSGTPLNSALV